jgi:hypothetical protein
MFFAKSGMLHMRKGKFRKCQGAIFSCPSLAIQQTPILFAEFNYSHRADP